MPRPIDIPTRDIVKSTVMPDIVIKSRVKEDRAQWRHNTHEARAAAMNASERMMRKHEEEERLRRRQEKAAQFAENQAKVNKAFRDEIIAAHIKRNKL